MGMNVSDMYKCSCDDCPLTVEIVTGCCCDDSCSLSCCDSALEKVIPKTADKSTEKHVPIIEKIDGGYLVKVGCVPHPMEEDHYIQLIELRTADEIHRKYLKPGMAPEATFLLADADAEATAVEFCNKHGFWEG